MPKPTFIDVDGINTRYYDVGSGPPLVLIHGGEPGRSAAADVWSRNISSLAAAGHRVVAVDRLGQGYTDNPKTDEAFTISSICEHLASWLRQIGIRDAHLIGQSRGSYVACHVAMRSPELARSLILCNSGSMSPEYGSEHPFFEKVTKGGAEGLRHDAELMSYTTDHINDEWLDLVRETLDLPKNVEARSMFDRLSSTYYEEFDARKRETLHWLRDGGFRKPALVLWGVGDPLVSLTEGVQVFGMMKTGSPMARMYVFDRCGHWPFREYPDEFDQVVSKFVSAAT